jgi:hypothetical protein
MAPLRPVTWVRPNSPQQTLFLFVLEPVWTNSQVRDNRPSPNEKEMFLIARNLVFVPSFARSSYHGGKVSRNT